MNAVPLFTCDEENWVGPDNTLHTDPAWGPHDANPASLHTVLDGSSAALQGGIALFFI
jgi:hypothetical protein